MFDLFRSRAKGVKIVLGALLMLVALSMVVTLIPGFGSGGGGQQDQIVAEIGKNTLTVQDVRKRLQMLTKNRSVPKEMMQMYAEQLLSALINEQVMVYEAQRLGFDVTPEEMLRGLQTMAPMLFQGGQFVGKEAYAAMLREQDLSIPEFEANVRTQMLVSKLEDLVGQGVLVTPGEVVKEYQRRNEKVKLEYVKIDPSRFRSEVGVSPDEVRSYYQINKMQFQVQEKRAFQLLVVDEAKVAQRIAAPEAELRKYYEANKDQFRTPDRVHARHILLTTTGKPKDEEAAIRAKAEGLLKQLKAGADFAELAKKNSDDPGSASKGGDLGWIVKGQTVPEFENTAFALKPKDLSGVVATKYGFHIIQALEREPARLTPFEEVKDKLAQEWKKQQVYETVQKLADQAHDLAVKNPAGAEQIARDLGIDGVKVDKAGAGDPVPDLGVNADFEAAVAGLPKNGVTGVLQAPGNKLVVAVVTNVFPARPAELSEVEANIRATIASQKLVQVVEQKTREALAKAKAAGGDLKVVAQAMGLEVKSTQEFARNGAADGIGPAVSVYQAFDLPVGSVFMPGAVGEDRLVCKVVGQTPADMTKLGEQRDAIARTLREDKLKRRTELLQDSLRNALYKEGKLKVHQDTINKLFESYRG
jgi:peptidyl-prolyl cis-trans isomerase D